MMAALHAHPDGVFLDVHVQPGAKRERLCGMHGDALKIAVREAAQDGRANAALVHLLAEILKLSRGDIQVLSGHRSRRKRLFIAAPATEVARRLQASLGHA